MSPERDSFSRGEPCPRPFGGGFRAATVGANWDRPDRVRDVVLLASVGRRLPVGPPDEGSRARRSLRTTPGLGGALVLLRWAAVALLASRTTLPRECTRGLN